MKPNKYIKMIVCMAANRVIGNHGALPWDVIPEDFGYFQRMTTGKVVIMGRQTFESIGYPLPNRRNWVLTSAKVNRRIAGVKWFNNPWDCVTTNPRTEKWVIGGSQIYKEFMPITSEIHVTKLLDSYEGDTWFPMVPDYFKVRDMTQFDNYYRYILVNENG